MCVCSETVCGLSKLLVELDRMVGRMVLESFGVEKHYDSLMNTNKFMLRVSEYPAPDEDEEKKQLLGLVPHHDKNVITIVCQNQVDGLDIETQDGQWIRAMPSPSSVIIFAGEAIRVCACVLIISVCMYLYIYHYLMIYICI